MKIKLKTRYNSCYTFNSPYPDENGRHVQKNTLAYCGNCDRCIEQAHYYKKWNYCPYCGEKIEWD